MTSSSSMVSTWAEALWFSSLKVPIMCWGGTRLGVRIPRAWEALMNRIASRPDATAHRPAHTTRALSLARGPDDLRLGPLTRT